MRVIFSSELFSSLKPFKLLNRVERMPDVTFMIFAEGKNPSFLKVLKGQS